MKAILIKEPGGPEVLTLGEFETPRPSAHEVLVKVKATALNRADTIQRKGVYPPPAGASPILGLEMSGEVVGLGSDISKAMLGDRVCALLPGGGYAEYVTVHEEMLIPIPDNMSFQDAAGIPEVFLTAYQALIYLSELKSGETILIHAGASGVGTAAIQISKTIGAKVFITASKGKHDLCQSLLADLCIDYKSENFQEVVEQATSGKGVDVVLDFLAASYFQKNIDSLALDGRMVMLAAMGGTKISNLNMGKMVWKRLKIMGSTLRARSVNYKIQLTRDFVAQFYAKIESGEMKPIIDSQYDWQDVVEAHKRMEANINAGKIILNIA